MKEKALAPWFSLLLIVLLVGLGIGLGIYSGRRAAAASQESPSWQQRMLAQFTQTLAVVQDAEQRAFLEAKIAPLQTQEAARQQALAQPAPTKPANPEAMRPLEPLAVQQASREPGIQEGVAAPVSPDDFTTLNAWQGEVDGQWVRVFAGVRTYQPEQGALIVLPENAAVETWVDGPSGAGALRIVAKVDETLLVEAADGSRLTFDLRTRALTPVSP